MDEIEDFDAFVRGRTPALMRSAFLLTGDQHLAEDLVQASLARTHQHWRRLDSRSNAEAYTRRVMYHLQVSWWRRRRVPEWSTAQVPEPRRHVPDQADASDLRVVMRGALARLPVRQRAVLVLRYFEDLTEAETAETLGVSVGTVKSQTFKALSRLRDLAPELAGHPSAIGGRDDRHR
ncbi:SigE family RNA polymerase sigma factor [Dactylosporangium sp. NBC_01737]|nr:SigE family RNA polymerase sigma factor [Dactylosporangium sp. NBC_01737]